jgi:hypothetical protein
MCDVGANNYSPLQIPRQKKPSGLSERGGRFFCMLFFHQMISAGLFAADVLDSFLFA